LSNVPSKASEPPASTAIRGSPKPSLGGLVNTIKFWFHSAFVFNELACRGRRTACTDVLCREIAAG
jgi:hypothetical protein